MILYHSVFSLTYLYVLFILQIVEVVLRQGLVHPITCVPFLIALETDPLEANSTLAHHLLMNMNEKYSPCDAFRLLKSFLFPYIC